MLIKIPWEEQVFAVYFVEISKRLAGPQRRQQARVNFEGFWPIVLRLSSKRPSVFGSLFSMSRLMQKLSFISVHWNFSEKMPPGRWKQVDHGFRSRTVHQFEELISPAQKTLKPCLPMCFKLISSRLERSEAGRIKFGEAWCFQYCVSSKNTSLLLLNV